MPDPTILQLALMAGLQMADFTTTLQMMDNGGTELNPLMRGVVENPVAFGAVKMAPIIGAVILRSKADEEEKEKLAKSMKIMNLIMGGIVASNIHKMINASK